MTAGNIHRPHGPEGPQGPAGNDGADGADGADGVVHDEWVFTSGADLVDGDQVPVRLVNRAVTLEYVRGYGAARATPITVDLEKNGTSVFPTTTKPDIPSAGGAGTSRVPDTTAVAQGDILTVNFAGVNGDGPVQVHVGYTY